MPTDYTDIEKDGTYWKNQNGVWFYWIERFGWCEYVGLLNRNFFNKFN